MNNRRLVPMIIVGVILLFVVMAISSSLFYTINATQRAVIFYKFSAEGLDKDNVVQPGYHMKAPWNDVFVYDVQETSRDENMDVLDKSGLSIT